MELLLLLSAFLTALTGAITGVRPVEAAAQEQVVGRPAKLADAVIGAAFARPVQGWPKLVLHVVEKPLRPVATDFPFGQRRRE